MKENDFFDEITDKEYSEYGYENDKSGQISILLGILLAMFSVMLLVVLT